MTKYIKPPRSEECEWRSGPPPEIGWWPASTSRDPDALRFWDGLCWSVLCRSVDDRNSAGLWGAKPSAYNTNEIRWTDRWWLK